MKCIKKTSSSGQSRIIRVSDKTAEQLVSESKGSVVYVPKKLWKAQERKVSE